MLLSKELHKKLIKFTENGECSQSEMAEYCGCHQTNISRILKEGTCSKVMYDKLLTFAAEKTNHIAQRKSNEAKLLTPIA